jgi:hypothetical protein
VFAGIAAPAVVNEIVTIAVLSEATRQEAEANVVAPMEVASGVAVPESVAAVPAVSVPASQKLVATNPAWVVSTRPLVLRAIS